MEKLNLELFENIQTKARYSPLIWSVANVVLPDGLWDFAERKWQITIMEDPYPRIVSKKPSQVGETTIFICKALWFMHYRKTRVIWTFPRQEDVSEFVTTRFRPILNNSPNIARYVGQSRDDPQTQRITKYRNSYIYFQEASVEPRMTTADLLANDEVDRSDPDNLEAFLGRLENSKYKIHYRFSTPTIPNFGIDRIFNEESDQRYWMVKCPHCGHRQSLKWDVNLMFDKNDNPYYGCEKCKRDLTPESIINGEYVAMYPGRLVHGYQVSGMMLPLSKPPSYMYHRFKTMKRKNFYNLLLGETYESSGLKFDPEVILSNVFVPTEEPYPHMYSAKGDTYMGVDQKGDIHVVIAQVMHDEPNNKDVLRIIHAEVIKRQIGQDSWARLAQLMRHYNIRFCVHDALPNEHNAQEFAEAFRGRVALKYDSGERAKLFTYDEQSNKLILSRTMNFDGLLDDIKSGLWRFYGTRDTLDPTLTELISHCSNMKRDEEERKRRDGSVQVVGVWRKTGPDDFAHAWAYCRVAYLVRPVNRVQITLIGQTRDDHDESIEYTDSKVWDGLKVPKKRKVRTKLG